jgi:carboxymethylenebutenolidase
MIEQIAVSMRDGAKMGAALAPVTGGPGVGIIMIPPIFGLDDGIYDIMGDWAVRGCPVLGIDLFHRTIPGPLGREGADRDKAQKRYAEFDVEQGVADLADSVAWLRKHPGCNGRVVVFGYCFGGRYAYLSSTRGIADGALSFHGTKIGLSLDEAKNLCRPLSIHVGDKDPSIPMTEVEATRAALAGNALAEIFVYPGCVHGFTGRGRPAYDALADGASSAAAEKMIRSLASSAGVSA